MCDFFYVDNITIRIFLNLDFISSSVMSKTVG